jgi:hypothetical protein
VERDLLKPLPSLRLRAGGPSVTRKVDQLSCIRYVSARYSVPTRLIGASVAVVCDHGAVCIVEPATGMIVAEHELAAPGTASILDDHYDGPRPAPDRGPRPRTTTEQQFCALGADAQAFNDRGRRDRQHPAVNDFSCSRTLRHLPCRQRRRWSLMDRCGCR